MNSNKPTNTLAIIGLVLGIIAILVSFFPCVGTVAFIPGIIGLILGGIAFMKAKDNGHPKGMATAVIIISIIACAISGWQMYAIKSIATNIKSEMKEYTSCEELTQDYETVKKEMSTITKKMESDNASFSSLSKMTKLGFKIGHFQGESKRLDCNLEFENPTIWSDGDGEGGGESENETNGEGEAESIKEEKDN